MKSFLLTSVAIGALVTINPALAADMPVKAPVRAPVVAAYNWTGCYVGGNVGYSWGRARGDIDTPTLPPFFPASYSISQDLNGVIGGGQIGCNRQFDNRWVLGIEADFQGSAEKHSNSFSNSFALPIGEGATGVLNQTIEAKIEWFGTLRGRVGFLISPTLMLYGTGGLAYGKVSATDNFSSVITIDVGNGPVTARAAGTIGDSKTKVGWTLGAGVEGALFDTRNWTWKVEYLYVDLGSVSGSGVAPLVGPYSWNAKFTDNILRVGLNYRLP
jgi:outer membrane immunogenic protein